MASTGDSLLDYFNVYLPYADNQITLVLTDNPEDRPIAAEFVVRRAYVLAEFEERTGPMFEGGPVRIGKSRILYGPRLSGDFDFKYTVQKGASNLWLTLESEAMRFELVKLCDEPGDIRKSFVSAPIKDYSPDRVLELERRFREMKRQEPEQKTPESANRAKSKKT